MIVSYQYVHKPQVRNIYISVYDRLGGSLIEQFSYKDLPMKMVIKWGWYFKYIHALLQVKYPKCYVSTAHYNVTPEGRTLERIEADRIKKETTTCKRMITKISNALKDYEENEKKSLFPNFTDADYIKAKKKLQNYKSKLVMLEIDLNDSKKESSFGRTEVGR